MKVMVEPARCVASGLCSHHAPAVFDQRDADGVVVVLSGEPEPEHEEAVLLAARACPTRVIHVED